MTTTAIIVAAGRGTRAGGDIPKQWQDLGGRSIAALAMQPFADHPRVAHLVLVLHPDDLATDLWRDTPTARPASWRASRPCRTQRPAC